MDSINLVIQLLESEKLSTLVKLIERMPQIFVNAPLKSPPMVASETFVFFIFVSIRRGHDIPKGLFFSPHNHKLLTEFNFIRFCQHFDIKKY